MRSTRLSTIFVSLVLLAWFSGPVHAAPTSQSSCSGLQSLTSAKNGTLNGCDFCFLPLEGAEFVSCFCIEPDFIGASSFAPPADHFPLRIERVGFGWKSPSGSYPPSVQKSTRVYLGHPTGTLTPVYTGPSPLLVDGQINWHTLTTPVVVSSPTELTVGLEFDENLTNGEARLAADAVPSSAGRSYLYNDYQDVWIEVGDNNQGDWVIHLEYTCSLGASLTSSVDTLYANAGGVQPLEVAAGPQYQGDVYWILGSLAGTSPGTPIGGGLLLPLNVDDYFLVTLQSPTAPVFDEFLGVLDASGSASAALVLQKLSYSFGGLTVNHAYVVIDGPQVVAVSNPVSLDLILGTEPQADPGPYVYEDEPGYGEKVTVFYDASSSIGFEAPIASYLWEFSDGTTSTSAFGSKDFPAGLHQNWLTVTDELGLCATAPWEVDVNGLPLAQFEMTSPIATVGETTWFDASASFDAPGGTIVEYQWQFEGKLKKTSGPITSYVFEQPEFDVVELTVIDDDGLAGSNIAELGIEVNGVPECVLDHSYDQQANLVYFWSNSYDIDSFGSGIVLYEWDFGDGSTFSSSAEEAEHVYASPGTYAVTLTVTDNEGSSATCGDSVSVP